MVIRELSPEYVPVELNLSQEERNSIQTVINMLDVLITKEIELYDQWGEEVSEKFDTAMEILVGLRESFPDVELRYYKE